MSVTIKYSPYPKRLVSTIHKIRYTSRRPSLRLANRLEKLTGIPAECWIFPEKFFNPEAAWVYKGDWPPDISHLKSWGRRWGESAIRHFPKRKPTPKKFRRWIRVRQWEDYRWVKKQINKKEE